MSSYDYLFKLVEKVKPYLPSWLFTELHYAARAYAGGKARMRQMNKIYQSVDELPEAVQRLPAKKKRQWMHVWNSVFAQTEDEERAFRAAWAAVQKQDVDLKIVKADDEKQLVYGVVYEPEVVDVQGDYATAEEIEEAAHGFLVLYRHGKAYLDQDHMNIPIGAEVVESFLAPVDFSYADSAEKIRKGSWVMVVHVSDPEIWGKVKNGELTGFSMAGLGKRQISPD
ncbi:MAG: ChaB family protein [Candidatus Aenigmatarchaeota archaeon]